MSIDDIEEKALSLSGRQRAHLAKRLLESLKQEPKESVDQAWVEEVERRTREVLSGEAELADWEEVRSRLYNLATER